MNQYYVYVVALDPDIWRNPKFAKKNPGASKSRAFYVGCTGKDPRARFQDHKRGRRTNKQGVDTSAHTVQRWGLSLVNTLTAGPFESWQAAYDEEAATKRRLRKAGYGVW